MSNLMKNKALLYEFNKRGLEVIDIASFSILNLPSSIYYFKVKMNNHYVYIHTIGNEIDEDFFNRVNKEVDFLGFKYEFAQMNDQFLLQFIDYQISNKFSFDYKKIAKPYKKKGSNPFSQKIFKQYNSVEEFLDNFENIDLSEFE